MHKQPGELSKSLQLVEPVFGSVELESTDFESRPARRRKRRSTAYGTLEALSDDELPLTFPVPQRRTKSQVQKSTAPIVTMVVPDQATYTAQQQQLKNIEIKKAITGVNGNYKIEQYFQQVLNKFSASLNKLKAIKHDPKALAICRENKFNINEHIKSFESLAGQISHNIDYWQRVINGTSAQKPGSRGTSLDSFISILEFSRSETDKAVKQYQQSLTKFIKAAKKDLFKKIAEAEAKIEEQSAQVSSTNRLAGEVSALKKQRFAEQLAAITPPYHLSVFFDLYQQIHVYLLECQVMAFILPMAPTEEEVARREATTRVETGSESNRNEDSKRREQLAAENLLGPLARTGGMVAVGAVQAVTYAKDTALGLAGWGVSFLSSRQGNEDKDIPAEVIISTAELRAARVRAARTETSTQSSSGADDKRLDSKHTLSAVAGTGTTAPSAVRLPAAREQKALTLIDAAANFLMRAQALADSIQRLPKIERTDWDMRNSGFEFILAFEEPIRLYKKFLSTLEVFVAAKQFTESGLQSFILDYRKFKSFFNHERLELYKQVIECVNAHRYHSHLQQSPQMVANINLQAADLPKAPRFQPLLHLQGNIQPEREAKRNIEREIGNPELKAETERASRRQTRMKKVLGCIFNNQYWTTQTNYQWLRGGVASDYGNQQRIPTHLAQLQKSIVQKLQANPAVTLPENKQTINFNAIQLRAEDIEPIQLLIQAAGQQAMNHYSLKFDKRSCGLFGSCFIRGLINQRSTKSQQLYTSLAAFNADSDSMDQFMDLYNEPSVARI